MTENTSPLGDAASRADEVTELLASAPKADDHAGVREYLRALAHLGCAPLLIYPASKRPADMRTPRQRNAEDKAAREAARAAGNPGWAKVESQAGVHLATTDTAVLDRYLATYANSYGDTREVNVAVSLGRSRLVVVDCDTAEQMSAFLADAEADPGTRPTVRTPGQLGPDGVTLVHRDGGHFYFTVPEGVELSETTGSMKVGGSEGYSVMWGAGNYVLTPPSVRPEGAYTATGAPVYPLPDWLAEKIATHGTAYIARVEDRQARIDASTDAVAQWGARVRWDAILAPEGWTPTGKADGCGCPTWTAPGPHGDPKSATAHEPGCTNSRWADSVDPPLHIWTDNPGEPWESVIAALGDKGRNRSKLQAVALLYYDDQMGTAMGEIGIERTNSDALAVDPTEVAFLLDDYRTPNTDAEDEDADTGEDDAGPLLTLPAEFWASHARLQLFHDMCLSHTTAPDAALGFTLARLAAHTPPSVRVTTGVRFSLPLNMFVLATSVTGAGKTTAGNAAEELVKFRRGWSSDPHAAPEVSMGTDDTSFPALGSLKTGEGLVEAYYGQRNVVIGQNKDGTDKTTTVRRVVRSNLLTTNDEGRTVITQINKEEASLGPTLREMWSGSTIGASLADKGRDRLLPRGTYSLGVVIGTQQSVLGDLVTRTNIDEGTVQRFLMMWSRPGPYVTAELLEKVTDLYPPLEVVVPSRPLRLCAPLRDRIKRENTTRFLGQDDGTVSTADPDEHSMDGLDSQKTAMLAKLAALLAVFLAASDGGLADPENTAYLVVGELEWTLAEQLFAVSCAIAADAAARRRTRRAKAARAERAVARAEHVADAEARLTPQGRERAKLIGALTGAGPVRWSGPKGLRNRMFNGNKVAAAELERMIDGQQVQRTEGAGGSVYVELLYA